MHPSSLLSYYPTYGILDEVLSHGHDTLNIYMDLRNNLQTLYLKHAIENIIENSMKSEFIDTSIFSSVISFLAFHKIYSIKRNLSLRIFIFFETGTSYYHTNISARYKMSRRSDNLYGIDRDKRDLFFEVSQRNLALIEKACNRIPYIKVIRLPYLEADFIPYHLIKNKLVDTDSNVGHVVYSNDHDLLQTLSAGEHVYIFRKGAKRKDLVKKNEVMKSFFKMETTAPDEVLPLAMAVTGDSGDDVQGVKGLGPKRTAGIIDELVTMVGGMETLYDNVENGNDIFQTPPAQIENKYIRSVVESEKNDSVISRNLKLVSFEMISRFMNKPPNTETIEKRDHMLEVLQSNVVTPLDSMKQALERNRVFLQDDDLDVLYHGVSGG